MKGWHLIYGNLLIMLFPFLNPNHWIETICAQYLSLACSLRFLKILLWNGLLRTSMTPLILSSLVHEQAYPQHIVWWKSWMTFFKVLTSLFATDFSKAFDRVNHTILVRKFIDLGMRPCIIPWICCFLSNRTQAVRLNGEISSWETLRLGCRRVLRYR